MLDLKYNKEIGARLAVPRIVELIGDRYVWMV